MSDGVDAYIAKAAPFAQPILRHIRALVHEAVDATEAIKWGSPHYLYRGKMIVGTPAFKGHMALILWAGEQAGNAGEKGRDDPDARGHYGRIRTLDDLPRDAALIAQIRAAAALIDAGVNPMARGKQPPKPLPPMHADFAAALSASPAAQKIWGGFAPSHRREYLDWINDAKRDDTRTRRIAQAIEWIAQGKQRNWKYMDC